MTAPDTYVTEAARPDPAVSSFVPVLSIAPIAISGSVSLSFDLPVQTPPIFATGMSQERFLWGWIVGPSSVLFGIVVFGAMGRESQRGRGAAVGRVASLPTAHLLRRVPRPGADASARLP